MGYPAQPGTFFLVEGRKPLADEPDSSATASSTMNLRETQPETVVAVRRWASAELTGLPDELLGDILLVVTELVSNAYDHGGGPSQVRLTHSRAPWSVEVAVEDGNTLRPMMGRSRFGAESFRGNGLVLVNELTTTWGVTSHPETGGKTVWARFSRWPDVAEQPETSAAVPYSSGGPVSR